MDNLAKDLSDQELIPKEDLEKYKGLVDSIKNATNDKDLLNKRIKAKLGDFVLSNLQALISPHSDLVDSYLDAVAGVSIAKLSGSGLEEADNHLKAVYAELQLVGISKEVIDDYVSGDRTRALSHNKLSLNMHGFKVATINQDRSVVNQDKAIAFVKRLGLNNLLVTKTVIDEAALEVAIINGEVDAEDFKQSCIDEKLVINLTIK